MDFIKTSFDGLFLIKPKVFRDARGFFLEFYSKRPFAERGIDFNFVQDNHSLSAPTGVVRGLHFQNPPHAQAKLVRVTRGAAYDAVVDLRKKSPTFGKWEGFELTEDNFHMLFIPRGFAHGFCTLADNTELMYKNDNFYTPSAERGIRWDDPTLGIVWPVKEPILSEKDLKLPLFAEFNSPF
jgi:dTDP-4-dehydrorhamnose 3,5-epimerase